MTTQRPESLGPFERLVLTAVVTLRDRACGVPIHAKVRELAANWILDIAGRCMKNF